MKNVKVEPSFFDNIRTLNISGIVQTIKDANIDWAIAAIFLGSGFLSGFLFKRYYKMAAICIAVGLVLIWGIDHFFHVIDWKTINSMIGDSPALRVDSFFEHVALWISKNIALTISFCIGSLIGIFV